VPAWPLARIGLKFSMFRDLLQRPGADVQPSPLSGIARRASRAVAHAASPLAHAWQSRGDFGHSVLWPRRADALFLGDGLSLDRVDGAWRDRYCDPLIGALETEGRSSLLMEAGSAARVPRARPTFAAGIVERWAILGAESLGAGRWLTAELPEYGEVLALIGRRGLRTDAVTVHALRRQAARVTAIASAFGRILKMVRPRIGYVVSYYWDIGYAFALACRRHGILSVELQHGTQGGQHGAYNRWLAVPENGYTILPAVFWNWTEDDVVAVDAWAGRLARPWHRGFHGGHPQLAAWFDGEQPRARAADVQFAAIAARGTAELEILVALQDVGASRAIWDRLAALIEASPLSWRWWVRRHPVAVYARGDSTRAVLALDRPNVVIEDATRLPLPALLSHMDTVLSLFSGASVEASIFGLKPIYLMDEARGLYDWLLDSGRAAIITDMTELRRYLEGLARSPRARTRRVEQPGISRGLMRLDAIAEEYRALCGFPRCTAPVIMR
jgi:hypothetical protein